jgi:hypothetical protein
LARFAAAWPAVLAGLFPVFFIPISVDAYILPRVLLLLAGGGLGLALVVGARRGLPAGSLRGLVAPCLAVAVAALLAVAFSVNPWVSVAGSYLRYESVVVRLGYVLLFCSSVWLLTGPGARGLVVTLFLAACGICAAEAIWEYYAFQHNLIWGLPRPDGNLGNAGLLGCVLAMALPLALWRVLSGGVFWPAWGFLFLVLTAGLLVSTSRAGWLAALLGCGLVVAARAPRRILPAIGGLAVLTVAGALWVLLGPLGALHADPSTVRVDLWARVLPMVLARPLVGWGEDTFGLVFGQYAHGYLPGVIFDRAHSQPLDLAAAQGVLGLLANAWFWVAFFVLTIRSGRWREEDRPALLAAVVAYWLWAVVNFDWAPATGVVWLLAAACWSPAEVAAPRRIPLPAGVAAAGVALAVAVVFGVLPVLADAAYYRGDDRMAATLDPLQARYHRVLGEQLVAQGRLADAAIELRRAGDLGEDDAQVWVELGEAETRLGHRAQATAAYARARQLDPTITTPPT